MAYDYYRTSVPGWGSSQFQFVQPPMPAFQPQPSWTGLDFFNAHAVNPDPAFYHSVVGGLGSYSGVGVDHRTARRLHAMIYSGLTPLTQQLPSDIGAAAAYEVYRTWKYNSSLHAPLSADRMMQREGLIGMAMAEATRLWQYTGRAMDMYGQRAACEAAAETARILADHIFSYMGGGASAAFPPSPRVSPYLSASPLPATYGSYPGGYAAPNAASYGGYSPAGSAIVVNRPRHRSHSRVYSSSHSGHGHHHHRHHHHHRDGHHHRSRSVEIIQPTGGGYGYTPYFTGGGHGYGGAGYGSGYGGYYPGYSSRSGCIIS